MTSRHLTGECGITDAHSDDDHNITAAIAEQHAEKYNGWTNRETWLVNLWIDNDEGLNEGRKRIVETKHATGEHIQYWIETGVFMRLRNEYASLTLDLLNGALAQVNWDEIAAYIREEYA